MPETTGHGLIVVSRGGPLSRRVLISETFQTKQDPSIVWILNTRVFIDDAIFDSDISPRVCFNEGSVPVEGEVATLREVQSPFAAGALGVDIGVTFLAFF